MKIAVVGAGFAGLALSYYYLEKYPNASLTIFEAKKLYFHIEPFKVSLALCGSKRQKPSIAVMIAVMRGRLRVGEEREEKGF